MHLVTDLGFSLNDRPEITQVTRRDTGGHFLAKAGMRERPILDYEVRFSLKGVCSRLATRPLRPLSRPSPNAAIPPLFLLLFFLV